MASQTIQSDRMITTQAACRVLSCDVRVLHRLRRAKMVRATRLGRARNSPWRWHSGDLNKIVSNPPEALV